MLGQSQPLHGFTLIELLVVITIIVTLLALLTPALDKAIYQAELAVCGANMRAVANASLMYAHDNKRRYATRRRSYNWDAVMLVNRDWSPPFNLRDDLADYIPHKSFLDPLAGEIDLGDESNRQATTLFANYFFYSGWGIPGYTYMERIGQRFTWKSETPGSRYSFSALVADRNCHQDGVWASASHPDNAGVLALDAVQDVEAPWDAQTQFGLPGSDQVTYSWWVGAYTRGTVDLNFGYDDGSVYRVNGVEIDDERLVSVVDTSPPQFDGGRAAQIPNR